MALQHYLFRGGWTVFSAPLLAVIVFGGVWQAAGSALLFWAFVKVLYAVFGAVGIVIIFLVGWAPFVLPPALWYSLYVGFPELWDRDDVSAAKKVVLTIVFVIALPLAAAGIQWLAASVVSWVADQNPCAAYAAGVTGSIPATNCE